MSEIKRMMMNSKLVDKLYSENKNLYRFFRVYHPVYEISVNIETAMASETYHIFEKYMDKIVCGYRGDDRSIDSNIYIESKEVLFKLLGINNQAYEIADAFFQDLVASGHFEETEKGIRAKKVAYESVKQEKRLNESTQREKKILDQFSIMLMPSAFYDLKRYSVKVEDVMQQDNQNAKEAREQIYSVWLTGRNTVSDVSVDVEQMLSNTDYYSKDRIDRGLPAGYKGMSIVAEEPVEEWYYPYYLAVYFNKGKKIYRAYRIDNGDEIPWIGEMYNSQSYSQAKKRIDALIECTEIDVENPLSRRTFNIVKKGKPCFEEGVTKDENGNYIWEMQEHQLENLLGLGEDEVIKKPELTIVTNYDIVCLAHYDAGKLVKIVKTEEQKSLMQAVIKADDEDLRSLYTAYLKALEIKKTYMDGDIVPTEFLIKCHKVIEAGLDRYGVAAHHIGKLYETGKGVTKDIEQAIKWIEEAAQKEHLSSMIWLGDIYYKKGNYQDYEKSLFWYRQAAMQGDKEHFFYIAWILVNGPEQLKNQEEAALYYQKAVAQGDATAMYNLALRYNSGKGVVKDSKRAIELLELSAQNNNTNAMQELADILYKKGEYNNYEMSLYWYRKLEQKGNDKNYFKIAWILGNGPSRVQNQKEAIQYYQKAAEQGDDTAMYNLAMRYRNGKGVSKDENEMLEWLKKAAMNGNEDAKRELNI